MSHGRNWGGTAVVLVLGLGPLVGIIPGYRTEYPAMGEVLALLGNAVLWMVVLPIVWKEAPSGWFGNGGYARDRGRDPRDDEGDGDGGA